MNVLEACKILPVRKFGPGEVILRDGERTGLLYILVSGSVEVVKDDIAVNAISEPGALFGEMSVLLNAPHTATVRTLEDSVFHVADDALGFLRSSPEITMELSQLLARKLHHVTSYLVDLKRQFADSGDHLAIVGEVVESLVNSQERKVTLGSDRYPDIE